jgi:hypothetical protein
MPPAFTFNDEALLELVNSPQGGVAKVLRDTANDLVRESKELLNVPAPAFTRKGSPRPDSAKPPSVEARAPKPRKPRSRATSGGGRAPYKRTGDLRDSVVAGLVRDTSTRMIAYVISAPSTHGGRVPPYAPVLLDEGFELAPPRVRRR